VAASIIKPPGGVSSNLLLWNKADAQTHNTGTTLATDGQNVDNWYDQSANAHNATTVGANPHWDEDAFNFNPAVHFTASSNEYLAVSGGIFDGNTITGASAYVVSSTTSGTHGAIFNEGLAGSNEDFFFLAPWGANNIFWQVGSDAQGTGRSHTSTSGEVIGGTPNLWSMGNNSSNSTSAGEEMYIRLNAKVVETQNGYDNSATGNNSDFNIGYWRRNAHEHNGPIAELIVYEGIPSALDEIKIQSYLAIKYGITLSNDNDADASAGEAIGSITEGDYVDSDGSTVIWDYSAYSSYHYDIAGLGRDDNQGLHQKQSKSVNSDAIVTMSTEAIGTTNAGISTTLTDGAYLLWGNNNSTSNAIQIYLLGILLG
jgi:hypothetical protein